MNKETNVTVVRLYTIQGCNKCADLKRQLDSFHIFFQECPCERYEIDCNNAESITNCDYYPIARISWMYISEDTKAIEEIPDPIMDQYIIVAQTIEDYKRTKSVLNTVELYGAADIEDMVEHIKQKIKIKIML